jgi:hypothetical protein
MYQDEESDISIRDVYFYFTANRMDALDRGYLSSRAAMVLSLREKLLSLPGSDFDAAIKTIEKFVADPKSASARANRASRERDAYSLYQATLPAEIGGQTNKVSKI